MGQEEQILALHDEELLDVLADFVRKDPDAAAAQLATWHAATLERVCGHSAFKIVVTTKKQMAREVMANLQSYIAKQDAAPPAQSSAEEEEDEEEPAADSVAEESDDEQQAAAAAAATKKATKPRKSPRSPAPSPSPPRARDARKAKSGSGAVLATLSKLPRVSAGAASPRRSPPAVPASRPASRKAAKAASARVAADLASLGSESSSSPSDADWADSGDSEGEDARAVRRERARREEQRFEQDEQALRKARRKQKHRADLLDDLSANGARRAFAEGFLENIDTTYGGRSLVYVFKNDVIPGLPAAFASEHGKKEMLSLARVIDALLKEDYSQALEFACRRLGGIHTGMITGNWLLCEKLEMETDQFSFVPTEYLAAAIKQVKRVEAMKGPHSSRPYSSAASSGGSGRGRDRPFTSKAAAASTGKSVSGAPSSSTKKRAGPTGRS